MDTKAFRKHGHEIIEWLADYFEKIEEFPVFSQVKPGEVFSKIPDEIPEKGEDFEKIFHDFNEIILPGMTHWQHPKFFGYFPSNNSFPSILGELLAAGIGAQCMKWQTSPAAAELEEKVLVWLKKFLGLPSYFEGVIQDTASTSTLCALLSAREKYSDFQINCQGFSGKEKFRVYCSEETHSSIEKGMKIAGLGKDNLIKISCDDNYSMVPQLLEKQIRDDINLGLIPICVIATLGTTGTTAIDPLKEIGVICQKHQIWLHVDAAYAGTALMLPEFRFMSEGMEFADSFVFNPHKWLFTNFDCSVYFVKEKEFLIRTFEIIPEYLKTRHEKSVNDYSNWGIQLGRRFRALKLWFVLRTFGQQGLREKIREHIRLGKLFYDLVLNDERFELMAPLSLNLICFRYNPNKNKELEDINELNEKLLEKINESGKLFLSHTKIKNKYILRFICSQTNVKEEHIISAWDDIVSLADSLES